MCYLFAFAYKNKTKKKKKIEKGHTSTDASIYLVNFVRGENEQPDVIITAPPQT